MDNLKERQSDVPAQNPLEDIRSYNIAGNSFIVEPVFKKGAKDTVGTILLRLIYSDANAPNSLDL